jgi:acyl-CoA synthetase (AMP-forming)/AMP-acid ligase II
VPAALWHASRTVLSGGRLHSPYGATEALPVATVASDEVDVTSVRGACVGRPLAANEVKIIAITDSAIAALADVPELPRGEIGEIIVRGPSVTQGYDALPAATALAKIPGTAVSQPSTLDPQRGGSAAVWHRMGDCGYLDAEGRLWFCGRKAERVETPSTTLHTEPCEQVFRRHKLGLRCALVGLGPRGQQRPAVVVEVDLPSSRACRELARKLRELATGHEVTQSIKTFYFRAPFPVDVRHNAKIHRLQLAQWAATAKGFESDPKR